MVYSPIGDNRILCIWGHIFSASAGPDSLVDCAIRLLWLFHRLIRPVGICHFSWWDTIRLASPLMVCKSVFALLQEAAASVFSHGSILLHGFRCCRFDVWFLGLASGCAITPISFQRWLGYLGLYPRGWSNMSQEDG